MSKAMGEKYKFFEWAWFRSAALASQLPTCATYEVRSDDDSVQPTSPLCVRTDIGRYYKSSDTIGHLNDFFMLDMCREIYK